ncbi:MAG: gamma-glutamyltransferase family protein [Betaproteobacteria bacterium]|nr:gamma-glutamyltransferase family protein [Betaproteobacteria bacterium]
MVASPHALASAAGADVLRAGGSAVDAAIATAAALGVLYPHMCGIGGDAFWLVYDAKEKRVAYLDGGGRAAASATLERFRGQAEIPFRGITPATLTTPGAVASFCEAHARHGRLPLSRCLQDAVHYAREGYPVTARLARWIADTALELAGDYASGALFLSGGGAPLPGARLRNVALARTLEAIGAEGRTGFYEGEVARALGRFSAERGGFFRAEDLAAQSAYWGEPIRGSYRGVTVYETPAPTQGFTVLEMLNLIEPLELGPYLGADHVHLLVQAKQLAYQDRDRWLADPKFANVPIDRLISKAYAAERRRLIDPRRALAWDDVPSSDLKGDTVYVAAVDGDGNAASLSFSLYGIFGACVTDPVTGVVLQNRAAYFSLDPAHPNRLQPGKVPLHTLIASLAFREDRLWAALGCMGADGQP